MNQQLLEDAGGHAFPHPGTDQRAGMTLRDWFAGVAPVGPISVEYERPMARSFVEQVARDQAAWRYAFADAMLAERKKAPR